jgi:hypothetical protein
LLKRITTGWKTIGVNQKRNKMASFKIMRGTAEGKTWKATGINPISGRQVTIQGGQKGTKVGKGNPDQETSFDARHEATGMTAKKYINKLRWDNKARFGSTISIPDEMFSKGTARKKKSALPKSGAKRKTAKKSGIKGKAAKKATVKRKTAPKRTARKQAKKNSVKK